jgi:hypothetical protein
MENRIDEIAATLDRLAATLTNLERRVQTLEGRSDIGDFLAAGPATKILKALDEPAAAGGGVVAMLQRGPDSHATVDYFGSFAASRFTSVESPVLWSLIWKRRNSYTASRASAFFVEMRTRPPRSVFSYL